MSLPQNARNILTETGQTVPIRERIAAVIQDKPAKVLARITGKTPKAAERWKAAENAMTVEALFALARDMDEVWEIVKAGCGRANDVDDAVQMIEQMRMLLAGKK